MTALGASAPIKVMGRYALFREIAAGGMAVVHLGRLHGPVGFARTVAIKRLYPQYARDPEFVSMFLDEARLAARIRHPNVVPTLDVVASSGELFLVMDYVHGESLARLVRAASQRHERIPPKVILSVAVGALAGLHSAHEARGARGEPLGIVHRDISPQNILVGVDGVPRIVDFGVAKAAGRVQTTRDGQLKGKIGYFAPEQISGMVSRKTDVFAMSIVIWEALTGRRLFRGDNDATTLYNLLHAPIAAPSSFAPDVPGGIDAAVLRGLERDPAKRFDTARDMALELERHMAHATPNDVGIVVERLAHETLSKRAVFVAEAEGSGPELDEDSVARIMSPSQPAPGDREIDADQTISGSIPRAAVPRPPGGGGGDDTFAPSGGAMETTGLGDADRSSRPPAAESTSLSHATSLSHLGVRRPVSRRIWVAVGAFASTVILAFVFASGRHRSERFVPVPPVVSAVPSAASAASDAKTASGGVVPEVVPTATAAASIAASSAPRIIPPPARTTPARPVVRKTEPRAQPRPPTTRETNHCAVPYTLDSTGRKKWKPECL